MRLSTWLNPSRRPLGKFSVRGWPFAADREGCATSEARPSIGAPTQVPDVSECLRSSETDGPECRPSCHRRAACVASGKTSAGDRRSSIVREWVLSSPARLEAKEPISFWSWNSPSPRAPHQAANRHYRCSQSRSVQKGTVTNRAAVVEVGLAVRARPFLRSEWKGVWVSAQREPERLRFLRRS